MNLKKKESTNTNAEEENTLTEEEESTNTNAEEEEEETQEEKNNAVIEKELNEFINSNDLNTEAQAQAKAKSNWWT